jgi:hypothetical protein
MYREGGGRGLEGGGGEGAEGERVCEMLQGKGMYEQVVNLLHEEEAVLSKCYYMQQTHR